MLINPEKQGTLSERVAIALFAFMRRGGFKCTFRKDPTELFTYHFEIKDLTDDGEAFGIAMTLNSNILTNIEDTPEDIEKFCMATSLKLGTRMLEEKLSRLLEYTEKSRLIIPGQ